MRYIINISIFFILLLSFISTPAPVNIEIPDLILIVLPLIIGVISFTMIRSYYLYKIEYQLVFAVILYIGYILISAILGIAHNLPIVNVMRSIGPIINFLPLLALSFMPGYFLKPWTLALALITVGLLQSMYHFFLYITTSIHSGSTLDVLIKRITLIDPRTSIPIFLALAILPIALLFNNELIQRKKSLAFISLLLVLTGLFTGVVTLTRAIMLAIIFGWFVFIVLFLYYQFRLHPNRARTTIRKLGTYTFSFIFILFLILNIPAVKMLFSGIIARFYNYSPIIQSNDYSNGRLYDEWIPAFYTWLNADLLSLFFGVGAGNPFLLLTGEEHAYTHNLCLYSLLYGGFFGLFACLWLYFSTFKTLIARAFETKHTIYLAYAALLSSMFFYVQLFAVYKLLAYNAMLFLIIALALSRPAEYENKIRRENI